MSNTDPSKQSPPGREPERGPVRRFKAFFFERLGIPSDAKAFTSSPTLPATFRENLIADYRNRVRQYLSQNQPDRLALLDCGAPATAGRARLGTPANPEGLNWISLGPSISHSGEGVTLPPVAGRVMGLAVSADGKRVYAASANGGVFRSDDGGRSWYPLMNAFDLHPLANQSDSLSTGAIAIDPDSPDRVYVGSGEGVLPFVDPLNVGPSYFGVGPVVSTDGGFNWTTESWNLPNPAAGGFFFQIAIDPNDRELAIAATDQGIYRREPRNQSQAGLPEPRPQDYLLVYNIDNGAHGTAYWSADGNTLTEATAGAGNWTSGLVFMPFTLKGAPWIVSYLPSGSVLPPRTGGTYRIYSIDGAGQTNQRQNGTWTANLLLMPFRLGDEAYFLRYDNTNRTATLAQWNRVANDGTFTDVQAFNNWPGPAGNTGNARWKILMPFTIEGSPYFLAYVRLGNVFNDGKCMLYRWSGNLEAQNVWNDVRDLGSKTLVLTPFQQDGVAYFQAYEPSNGSATIYRWDTEGNYQSVRVLPNGSFPNNLQMTPFDITVSQEGFPVSESRFIAYDASNGTFSVYFWAAEQEPRLISRKKSGTQQTYTPFFMGYQWVDKQAEIQPPPIAYVPPNFVPNRRVSSIVVARSGDSTVYYAAFWARMVSAQELAANPDSRGRGEIYHSLDRGQTWRQMGHFPANSGRITLAVQPTNDRIVYAFVESGEVYRFQRLGSNGTDTWIKIQGLPDASQLVGRQGNYDLAIAVSPDNVDQFYLGGATVWARAGLTDFNWNAALYRCNVTVDGTTADAAYTLIGGSVHADVHALTFSPGNPRALWVGCDGGVFFAPNPDNTDVFETARLFQAMNLGLSCMTVNKIGQNPNQDAVIFSGNQDNGIQRYVGDPVWSQVFIGDSGGAIVNEGAGNDLQLLATYVSNIVYRSINGGERNTWRQVAGGATGQIPMTGGDFTNFYAPLVSGNIANRAGFGSRKPWVTNNFGTAWVSIPNNNDLDILPSRINAMVFNAAGTTLWVGLNNGQIYNYILVGAVWGAANRLDNVGGAGSLATFIAALPNPNIPITSIAVDPSNATSFYVTLGGNMVGAATGWQRVWHFDSAANTWAQVSGPGAGNLASLINVQFNAIVGTNNGAGLGNTLYAGSDVGIWRSIDSGTNWAPFAEGLPEAAVVDLRLFPAIGAPRNSPTLLRASTYGRGVYERVLENSVPNNPRVFNRPVQLYMRATQLDRGLYNALNNEPDPANGNNQVSIRDAAGIKVSEPDAAGNFPFPEAIDFYQYSYEVVDRAQFLQNSTQARVYIQVMNRGILPADGVQVTAMISSRFQNPPLPAPPALPANPLSNLNAPPDLPAGYELDIQNSTFLSSVNWNTRIIAGVDNLVPGKPEIIGLNIPADNLSQGGVYAILAFLTSPDDPFGSNTVNVENLAIADSKVALKYLKVT